MNTHGQWVSHKVLVESIVFLAVQRLLSLECEGCWELGVSGVAGGIICGYSCRQRSCPFCTALTAGLGNQVLQKDTTDQVKS